MEKNISSKLPNEVKKIFIITKIVNNIKNNTFFMINLKYLILILNFNKIKTNKSIMLRYDSIFKNTKSYFRFICPKTINVIKKYRI